MNRWIKRIGIACGIPIILLLLISLSLYIPPLQEFAKEKATRYASDATGMEITIGKIRLSFPLNLVVEQIRVVAPPTDTLLLADKIRVSIKLLPLLKSEVAVNGIEVQKVVVNSGTLLPGMSLKGVLGKLYLTANRIDLATGEAVINSAELYDARLTLLLNDTIRQPDTTTTSIHWKIQLQSLALERVAMALDMPADSSRLSAFITNARLKDGVADLREQLYGATSITLSESSFSYNTGDTAVATAGFNPSHLELTHLNIALDSVFTKSGKNSVTEVAALIKNIAFRERSGLEVTALQGGIRVDSTVLSAQNLHLATPYSSIDLSAKVAISAFSTKGNDGRGNGQVGAILSASVGKEDVFILSGTLPEEFLKAYPNTPFTLRASADGTMEKLYLRTLEAELPGAFKITASGQGEQLTDSLRRGGKITLLGKTGDLQFLTTILPAETQKHVVIPRGIGLKAEAALAAGQYRANAAITEGKGSMNLTARYDTRRLNYAAELVVDSMQAEHFLPHDSLRWISGSVAATGHGTDFFSGATSATVTGKVHGVQYGGLSISGITLDGSLLQHKLRVVLNSTFRPATLQMNLNGILNRNHVQGTLVLDAERLDLHALHLMKDSFVITLKDIVFTAQSAPNATDLQVKAGDLLIKLTGDKDISGLSAQLNTFSTLLSAQLKKETVNLDELRRELPSLKLDITAGKDNPIYNFLALSKVSFSTLNMNLNTSPTNGLNGELGVYSLKMDTLRLDTVRLALWQDTTGILFNGGIINSATNKQHVFATGLEGGINNQRAEALFRFTNGAGETGLLLGIRAVKEREGLALHFYPEEPVVAFRTFHLNRDNYIRIGKSKQITANLRMEGPEGMALLLHSDAAPDTTQMKTLNLDIRKINLALISGLAPYMPEIGGLLSANVQYATHDSAYQVNANMGVDSLTYERRGLGNLQLNASYLPGENKSHHIAAHLLHNSHEVLTAKGTYYKNSARDSLLSKITLTDLPLWIANAFIPEDMASVAGALKGELSVGGHLATPEINGQLNLDTASVFVNAAATRFRFDDKQVQVVNNRILFNQFNITTTGKNPFIIDGWMDAADPARILANLSLSAANMELINVKRNKQSLVYGKMYVDLHSTVRGPLDALVMRGNIQLLGNTDLTYVLKDSPLTVQDRLADLVTFVNFADTTLVRKDNTRPLQLGGLDMLLTIRIDQAVRLKADLSEDRESRVELEGGGDLSFQYTPQGNMILTGRYTLSGGQIKYTLPVVPSKTFTIQNGSYVQWSGNAMDPVLSITALQRVRTSVTQNSQPARMINFDVSIAVKNQLENLSLVFNLAAPEDPAMQNELTAQSSEERSKEAVSMLVTNMYMGPGSSASGKMNLDMGNALNSFLQNEINNLAGSALKGVDVSFGMENQKNGTEGQKQTDYSFRFSKRFYNDRIRVIVGGKISTGAPEDQNQSFIDNISIEYRLDASGTRYIRLFHNKNYESVLEGEITETGAGVVLRKKMRRLRELFIFRKKQKQEVQSTQSTLK